MTLSSKEHNKTIKSVILFHNISTYTILDIALEYLTIL